MQRAAGQSRSRPVKSLNISKRSPRSMRRGGKHPQHRSPHPMPRKNTTTEPIEARRRSTQVEAISGSVAVAEPPKRMTAAETARAGRASRRESLRELHRMAIQHFEHPGTVTPADLENLARHCGIT